MRNPMQSLCGAHSRTTGLSCQNYQMPNGRCRMHGGKSTGRPVKSGQFTALMVQDRRSLRELNREIRELLRSI